MLTDQSHDAGPVVDLPHPLRHLRVVPLHLAVVVLLIGADQTSVLLQSDGASGQTIRSCMKEVEEYEHIKKTGQHKRGGDSRVDKLLERDAKLIVREVLSRLVRDLGEEGVGDLHRSL